MRLQNRTDLRVVLINDLVQVDSSGRDLAQFLHTALDPNKIILL